MTTQCCVCKKILSEEQWIQPEEEFDVHSHVSHGYCPECLVDVDREIAEYLQGTPARNSVVG